MVYGDHFPVKDIVAHELTHAVTQHEANLQYIWQSGALNESFSDIFAAMIDREDWLIGEDLPEQQGLLQHRHLHWQGQGRTHLLPHPNGIPGLPVYHRRRPSSLHAGGPGLL